MPRTQPPNTQPILRFPQGGVWALKQPSLIQPPAHQQPPAELPTIRAIPGDLTTDRVLDDAERDLRAIARDVAEIRGIIDDVIFRFPSPHDSNGWSPSAA